MTEPSRTGVENELFDLVSVLYHSLQGGQTYDKYIEDAGSNQELVQFFQQVKSQDQQRAQQALGLLRRYVQG